MENFSISNTQIEFLTKNQEYLSLTRIQNLSLMTKFKCPNVERSMARIRIELNEMKAERGRDPNDLSQGLICRTCLLKHQLAIYA